MRVSTCFQEKAVNRGALDFALHIRLYCKPSFALYNVLVGRGYMSGQIHRRKNNVKQAAKKQSTQTILSAAARVLYQRGFSGATIARVAEEAGVSRGLLHYYFRNKEDMLAKVLRDNMATTGKLLGDILNDSVSAEHLAAQLTSAFREIYDNKREFFTLFMEGISISRQSETIMKEMRSMYMEFRSLLQKSIETMKERNVIKPEFSAMGLASLITGLLDGLGLQLIMVPEVGNDNEVWKSFERGIVLLIKGTV